MRRFVLTLRSGSYILEVDDPCVNRHDGKAKVAYRFERVTDDGQTGKDVIFDNDDVGCSPMHEPESDESVRAIIGFLSLRKGDTDAEFFDAYTPRHLKWRDEGDPEQLSLYACDPPLEDDDLRALEVDSHPAL